MITKTKINLKRFIQKIFLSNIATKSDIELLYSNIYGLFNINNSISGRIALNPMRGWAISPDVMTWVLAGMQVIKNPLVIEFGSGQSTIILAATLKHLGGKLISVEHDVEYSQKIQSQLIACGLSDVVRTLHIPLVNYVDYISYDISCIADLGMPDLAIVDGPPSSNGLMTRYIPLKWCVSNMKKGGLIYLDDSFREGEKLCISKLEQEFPQVLKISELSAEKGLTEIRLI